MVVSQLTLAKRKTLVKIFGDLKKKYKSLQKSSRTEGFQLMRRIVEYPLNESNFNQSFRNNLNYSNNKETPFYKRDDKRVQKKTLLQLSTDKSIKVIKNKKKFQYSQFFTKTPNKNNTNLVRLATFKIQASSIPNFVGLQKTHSNEIIHEIIENLYGIRQNKKNRINNSIIDTNLSTAIVGSSTNIIVSSTNIQALLHTIEDGSKPFGGMGLQTMIEADEPMISVDETISQSKESKIQTNFVDQSFLTFRHNSKHFAFQHYLLLTNSKEGIYNKPPFLKSRKNPENIKIETTKTARVLANQKVFTYFNHPIFLSWSVRQRKNKYLAALHLLRKPEGGKQRNICITSASQMLASPLEGYVSRPRTINTIFDAPPIPPLPPYHRRWYVVLGVWGRGDAPPIPHITSTTFTTEGGKGGKGVKVAKHSGVVQKTPQINQNFSLPALNQTATKVCNFQSCGNKMICSNEPIFQESVIPLLSESDQVTFVADFKETLNLSISAFHGISSSTTLGGTASSLSQALHTTSALHLLRKPEGAPPFQGRGVQQATLPSNIPSASQMVASHRRWYMACEAGGLLTSAKQMVCTGGNAGNKHYNNMGNTFPLFPGQLLTYGDTIANNIVTTESGQVLYVDSQKTTLRKAQTVLIYSQAIIAVLSGEWIKKGTPLMSLSYQKLVTGDIVQGLPKIEQFFEAPVLKDGTFWSDSLQAKLNQFFQEQREQLPLAEAVRKGFSEIQRVLVEGVQRVYISQGVLIADKHLEVIVRQMTCKGRILYSGDTGFLRNELVSLDKIENVNQVTYGQKALYHPQVRGITDASLESESFLSAASFQETTRVLSRDAIIGKTDLMRGLKERVIVGELIQAGTGLANNSVYNLL